MTVSTITAERIQRLAENPRVVLDRRFRPSSRELSNGNGT